MTVYRCMAALLVIVITAGTGQARAVDQLSDCPGVWVAFQMMPEAPEDLRMPLPAEAVFFGGNRGGRMRVNQESYTQLPMARFLVKLSVKEASTFYRKELGSQWEEGEFIGAPVFYRRADLPKGGSLRDLLLSKPGARPTVMFTAVEDDGCAQKVLKGARTMIEIVFEQ